MGSTKRIYNKFRWWSVDDCACLWCRHWRGKKRGCALDECCCEGERQEALRREQAHPAARKEAA